VRKDERRYMIEQLQKTSPVVRNNLANMMRHGYDPKVAAYSHHLQDKANDTLVKGMLNKPEKWVENVFAGALGFTVRRIESFEKSVIEVRDAMYRYQVLDSLYDSNMQFAADAKKATKESLERLNVIFSSEVERFKLGEVNLYGDISRYKAALWNKGFILKATSDVEKIIKVAKYLKIAGAIAMLDGIGKDVVEIIHRIWAGQPWFKKFLEDVAEIAAGVLIGLGVGLLIGSGGWVAILAAGVVSGTVNTIADSYIKQLGDKV